MRFVRRLLKNQKGQSAFEYGAITLVVMLALALLSQNNSVQNITDDAVTQASNNLINMSSNSGAGSPAGGNGGGGN